MVHYERLGRRSFISQIGKGVFGVVVIGSAAACSDDGSAGTPATTGGTPTAATNAPASTVSPSSGPTSVGPESTPTSVEPSEPPTTLPTSSGVAVERVDLGFVSAYVVVRGTEAAIVDTGVSGSDGAIAESLAGVGLGWSDVGHVILTHLHRDHVGSLGPVMNAASDAAGYAGEADIPRISSPRTLTPVATGDRVFGLDIISTPGHTPGHVSVFDPVGRSLITGDAINGAGSGLAAAEVAGVAGPNPDFTSDLATARESVAVLAALEPAAIFFGHGRPLLDGAAAALQELASS